MNKKGSIEDSLFVVILLFITALVFIFSYVINNAITTVAIPAFESVAVGSSVGMVAVNGIFDNTLNYVYLAAFFGLLISLIVTAFLTPTHPIFYIFSIIIFMAMVLVSVILSNMYESIISSAIFTSAVSHLTIMNYIMLNLPLIAIVIGVLAAIIIFSRAGSTQPGAVQ